MSDKPGASERSDIALAAALFVGSVVMGAAGVLAMPRVRRAQWAREAGRALRLAGRLGLAIAAEAAAEPEAIGAKPRRRAESQPTGMARRALAALISRR